MERILSKIEIERKIGRVVFKMELRFEKCHVLKSEKFYRISFEENYVVSFNYSLLERINELTNSVHASIQINDYSRIYSTEIRVRHVNFTLHYSTYYITYSKQLYVKRHFINIQFARISDAFVTRNCCKRWSISLDFHGDEKRRNRE